MEGHFSNMYSIYVYFKSNGNNIRSEHPFSLKKKKKHSATFDKLKRFRHT